MKKNYYLTGTWLACCIFCFGTLNAQNGMYQPANADYSYPRTLLDATAVPAIRATLSEADKMSLYSHSWIGAFGEQPDNHTAEARWARAVIAYDAAFVLLMRVKPHEGNLIPINAVDSGYFANKVIRYLNEIADEIPVSPLPSWTYYNPWQGHAKELNLWLQAYDFMKGAGISDGALVNARRKLQGYVGNLCVRTQAKYPDPITGWPSLDFFDQQPNNHAIMMCSTLGLAAIVLNDVDSSDVNYKPNRWMNIAIWNLDNVMWRVSFPFMRVSGRNALSGYYEGPSYYNYAFDSALPFFRALWNFIPDGTYPYLYKNSIRQIRHPWYDPNYRNLAKWMNLIRMPDGTFPAVHDSPQGLRTNLLIYYGLPEYNVPYNGINYYDYRVPYLCVNVAQGSFEDSLFQVLPNAGSVVFRSDYNKKEAIYLHLIAKNGDALTGAKGHHQGDATSFELYYNGEIMALDPGYPAAPYRDATDKPTDHNLVLVNGRGPEPPITDYVNQNNATYIENAFSLGLTDYVELKSRWYGADLRRRVIFPHRRYFVVSDFVAAEKINQYTFQLHGNGLSGSDPGSAEGAFSDNFSQNTGIYTRGNTHLSALTLGNQPCVHTTEPDSLAIGTNTYRLYNKWCTTQQADTTAFLSVLFPFKNPAYPQITDISEKTGCSATAISSDGFHDVTFAQSHHINRFIEPSLVNFPKQTGSDGLFFWASAQNRDQYTLFAQEATRVFADSALLWQASHPVNLLWQTTEDGFYEGYINDSAVVEFHTPTPLYPAENAQNALGFYEWIAAEKLNRVYFTRATYFKFEAGTVSTEHPTTASSSRHLRIAPNPAAHQIALSWSGHDAGDAAIEISDVSGKVIIRSLHLQIVGQNEYLCPVSVLPPGWYQVRIKSKQAIYQSTFTKL